MTTTALSAQEEAIESGQKVIHRTGTTRSCDKLKAIGLWPARVTLDRAVLFTASFQETEHQPLVLRWAKALYHFFERSPAIFPRVHAGGQHRLDGGASSIGRWQRHARWGRDVPAEQRQARRRHRHRRRWTDHRRGPHAHWAGKDYATNFIRSLPEETRFMLYGPDPHNLIMMTLVVFASSPMRHSQNWTPDFSKILTRGAGSIRPRTPQELLSIALDASITHRYAPGTRRHTRAAPEGRSEDGRDRDSRKSVEDLRCPGRAGLQSPRDDSCRGNGPSFGRQHEPMQRTKP